MVLLAEKRCSRNFRSEVLGMKKLLSFIVILTLLVSSSAVFANAVCSTDYFPIEQPPGVVGAEVYGFSNPDGWEEVYVYARYGWAGDVENAPWPGVKLYPTYVPGYGEIYEYSFASGYYRDIIFNDGSPIEENPYHQYKDRIYEILNEPYDVPYVEGGVHPEYTTYQELYYYFGTEDDVTPEYVLIELRSKWESPLPRVSVFGNYLIRDLTATYFKHGYGVYLPFEDRVLSLPEAYRQGVEGIEECIPFCGGVELIGDMNKDGKLSVADATFIQKQIAELEEDPFDTLENYKYGDEELPLRFKSDFDRDGKRTVKDATAVQKYLAGLPVDSEEKEIPYHIVDEFRVEYDGTDIAFDLCTSREEAEKVYASFNYDDYGTELGGEYNDVFFREYSLVFMTSVVGGSNCYQEIGKMTITNNLLSVYRDVYSPAASIPDMNVRVTVFAVRNAYLEGVTRYTDVRNDILYKEEY